MNGFSPIRRGSKVKSGSKLKDHPRRGWLSRAAVLVEPLEKRIQLDAPTGILLNEVDDDPDGTDNGFEFIEVRGGNNQALTNVYFASVEGDSESNLGRVTYAYNLNSQSLGSAGLLLIKSPNNSVVPPSGTTVVDDSVLNTGSLQNGSNSFLLIYSPTTPIVAGTTGFTDLDTNTDGAIDLPADAEVLDGFGWYDIGGAAANDRIYSSVILTQAATTNLPPDAATRFPTNTDPLSFDAWYNGDLVTSGGPSGLTYISTTTRRSANFPAGAVLTPGAANFGPVLGEVVGFSATSYSVNEADGTATITVNRTGGVTGAVDVNYTIAAGSASSPADFSPTGAGVLHFLDQDASKSFTVSIVNDTDEEDAETISLTLNSATNGASLGTSSSTLSIISDDGTPLLMNEVDVNPPSLVVDDAPYEYAEFRGRAGASLNNVYFVSVEGDTGGSTGSADVVISLSGSNIGSNGLAILKATSGGFTPDAGTTVIGSSRFNSPANGSLLENGANSFIIVYSLAPIVEGTDLDANNDGVFDGLPAGAVVLDGVGWQTDTINGAGVNLDGVAYGTALTQTDGTPNAATRFIDNLTPFSTAAWFNGNLLDDGAANASKGYDPAKASANYPINGAITPGAPNVVPAVAYGELGFSLANYAITEDVSGHTVTITVNRTNGSNGNVTVHYDVTPGTTDGSDFTPTSGTLDFPDTVTTATFDVTINDDSTPEATETINLTLSNPTDGAALGTNATSKISIYDNDSITAPSGIVLNEIDVNPPSTDNPQEFIELRQTSVQPLYGVYVLAVKGDTNNLGQVTASFDITAAAGGSNGLIVIGAPDSAFNYSPATVVTSSLLDTPAGGLQNSSISFLVVFSPTVILSNADLDTDNDGVLDLPVGASVIDGVGWTDGDGGDVVYGSTPGGAALTQASGIPDAATRFPGDVTANSAAAWYNGDLTGAGNTSTAYSGTAHSANFPAGGALTPGAINVPAPDNTPPTLDSKTFIYDSGAQRIELDFSESVLANFSTPDDLTLINLTNGNAQVPAANINAAETAGNVIALTFTDYPGNALPDGYYQLTLTASGIKDDAGNALQGTNPTLNFFIFVGDANHSSNVNALDFNAVAVNYGQSGKTFSTGDFNYDGQVTSLDFDAVATNYNKTYAALPAPLAGAASAVSLFSDQPISAWTALEQPV